MKHVLVREAELDAPPEQVWDVLVDLARYAAWNPWITRAEGAIEPGATVEVEVVLGPRTLHLPHRVTVVEPVKRFAWKDAGWTSWFVDGERERTLEPLPGGRTRFRQELRIGGLFARLARRIYGDAMEAGLAAETDALRAVVGSPR